ncbi:MAG: hypothetical protein IJV41_01985 [Oscillospiraceae bacterium]|nr:hypothetical protein [Oscillospiraceae bacterium]
MKRTGKELPIILAALAVLAALGYGGARWHQNKVWEENLAAAQSCYEAGDYAAAKEWFQKNGMTDEMADCDAQLARLQKEADYASAERLLAEGKYLDARDAFLTLGETQRAQDCDYARALSMLEAERYDEAIALLEALGDYPGAADTITRMKDALYDKALEATYACRMDEAIALWNQLGDYRDAVTLCRRCNERIVTMAQGNVEPVRYPGYTGMDIGSGTLYWHRVGEVYVPKEVGPETRCMIFFPGGYDESLPNNYMTEYIYSDSPPNAIMLFCYANGLYHMPDKIEDAYRVLEEAALENDVFIHDLVLCGASNGAYTACMTAAQLYEDHGVCASYVLTFDAGMHWQIESQNLSPEQCDSAAAAGTAFLLLEGGGVGMNVRAIELMVAHGVDVTVVECAAAGHYGIIYDAMAYGMIDWTLGQGDRPENSNYTYYKLDRNSTYPWTK